MTDKDMDAIVERAQEDLNAEIIRLRDFIDYVFGENTASRSDLGRIVQEKMVPMHPTDEHLTGMNLVHASREKSLHALNAELVEALEKIEAALRKDSRDKSIIGDAVEYHLDGQTMGYAINTARAALSKAKGEA
jgi:hypothetical protein